MCEMNEPDFKVQCETDPTFALKMRFFAALGFVSPEEVVHALQDLCRIDSFPFGTESNLRTI